MQFLKHIFITILICISHFSFSQNNTIDSLNKLLITIPQDCDKAAVLFKIGKEYISNNQNEPAIKFGLKSLYVALKYNCDSITLQIYNMLGIAYDDNGDYPQAKKSFKLGLQLSTRLNDLDNMSVFYTNLGETCRSQADYANALEYFLKALKIDEASKNENRLVSDYFILALLYGNLDEVSQEKKYLFKALQLSIKIKNKRVESKCYNIYANRLSDENKIDSALYYYNKSLMLAREINLKHLEAKVLSNIGSIYRSKNDYTQAIIFTNNSVKINSEIGDYKFLAADYISLGWIYSEMNNLLKSKEYFNKALELSFNKFIDSQINAYKGLAMLNSKLKNFEKAYEYHVKYKNLDDSIYNVENSEQLGDIKINYEVEKKESELKAQQDKLQMVSFEEKKRQQIIIYAVIGILIIVLFFSIILFKRFKLTNLQKEIIELKSIETEEQKYLIEEKQKEIIDSIKYAKRIQNAILPQAHYLNDILPQNFVLYRPKDIIAGDFYWMHVSSNNSETNKNLIFIAAADSTGHGVPGTMVSIVCSNALDKAVKEFGLTDTGKILDKTTELVIETFAKSGEEISDGMDISLLCIDKENNKIFWSGANNPLLFVNKNKLHEIKPNKQPIGKSEIQLPFKTHEIPYEEGTIFYLMTDGYRDQFGGPNGKKFKYKQLENLIFQNHTLSLKDQCYKLIHVFDNWKGELEQVDDVTIVGIKI